jgi:hypothetical protein
MFDHPIRRRSLVLGALAAPLASMAGEPSWDELLRASDKYTADCQSDLESRYRFSEIERWDRQNDAGGIVFSTAGRPVLLVQFQYVGSVSKVSDTWLWSWANDSMAASLTRDMERVREYGKRRGFSKLTKRQWKATEDDGWDMAAVANYLLKAKGVYRFPGQFGVAFVVFTDVKKPS